MALSKVTPAHNPILPPLGIWPQAEWNPVIGCSVADYSCARCYAAARIAGLKPDHPTIAQFKHDPPYSSAPPYPQFSGVLLKAPGLWESPLTAKEPEVVFAFSMSDLFHDALSEADIGRAFDVMKRCPASQFNISTKRPKRMATWRDWPDNVRIGVSAPDAHVLRDRWSYLRDLPARWKYLSIQPMLDAFLLPDDATSDNLTWVQVMREVGPGARGMKAEWAGNLRAQCEERGIVFAWEITDVDSPECQAERRAARMRGHPYITQRPERMGASQRDMR